MIGNRRNMFRRTLDWVPALIIPLALLSGFEVASSTVRAQSPSDRVLADETETADLVLQLDPIDNNLERPIITALAISSDERLIAASGDDHAIRILDAKDGKLLHLLRGHTDWVQSLDFSQDGTMLVSCGNDREIRQWVASDEWKGKKLYESPHALYVTRLHPDNQRIFFAGFGPEIACWSIDDARITWTHTTDCNDLRAIDFSPRQDTVAWGGRNGVVHVFDVEANQELIAQKLHSDRIRAVCLSPDGWIVTSVGEDRRIIQYDVLTEHTIHEYKVPTGKLMSLTMLDSSTAAVGASDNAVHIYDSSEGEEVGLLLGHRGSVRVLAHSTNMLLSSGYDTEIRIWNLNRVWRDLESHPVKREIPEDNESNEWSSIR